KPQREKLLRLPIHQNPRGLFAYFDQIRSETVGAINVLDQSGKLIMGNCFLVLLQDSPFWLRAKDSKIIRGLLGDRKDQQAGCQQCDAKNHFAANEASMVGFRALKYHWRVILSEAKDVTYIGSITQCWLVLLITQRVLCLALCAAPGEH